MSGGGSAHDRMARAMALMSAARDPGPPLPPAAPAAAAPAAGRVLTADGARGRLSGLDWAGFTIGDLLGAGASGEVYRAWQPTVGRAVALKVLTLGGSDPAQRQRCIAEARAAGQLRHQHVVAVYDSGEHDGRLWLAMELIEGTTLSDDLHRRRAEALPYQVPEAIRLALQAATGLAAVHRARLVHRDIKPGNLLLGRDGTVHISDFGLVRILDENPLTATGMVIGTPLYMAPEQGRGHPPSARADVYGMGCVLYELLTLRPPFSGSTAEELISLHNFAEPDPPSAVAPGIPREVEAVCLACLQKDPDRRYPDAEALAADLSRLRDGQRPATPAATNRGGRITTGAAEAVQRLVGRRRHLLASGAVLAAVVLTVAAGWWWWDARKVAVATLRERLAPLLERTAPPPTAAADLERLAELAGDRDPMVVGGRGRLDAIRTASGRLDALESGSAPEPAAVAAAVDALEALVGPDGHPGLGRWRGLAATAAARLAEVRSHLAPQLAGLDLIDHDRRRETAGGLELFLRLAPAADPDRQRWSALIGRTDAAIAADRRTLGRAQDAAVLASDELDHLDDAARRLARLAGQDSVAPAAVRRISDERRELASRRQELAQLLGADDPGPRARAALAATAAWLGARAAIDDAEARLVRRRLDEAESELSALRERLGATGVSADDLGRGLPRYLALAGPQDPAGIAWLRRLDGIRDLKRRLGRLDRPGAGATDGAEADLAALVALVGGTDPDAVRWGSALAGMADARARLAVLDRPGEAPAWTDEVLERLAAAAGDGDPDVRRWRGRLGTCRRLSAALDALGGLAVLPAADREAALADLAAWQAMAGDDDRARRAVARLAELSGPGRPAWAADAGHDANGPWVDIAVGPARARLRWLAPQSSAVGSPADDPEREDDETPVRVVISRGCWIADQECPQQLWTAVMGPAPSSVLDPLLPVEQVSRTEAEAFCLRLGASLGRCSARLPEEREWELAARCGRGGTWASLDRAAAAQSIAHQGSAIEGPVAAGALPANPGGLHEMAGNLWEWCRGPYGPIGPDGLVAPLAGSPGVVRGGSWRDPLGRCRPANRAALDPGRRSPLVGFRFVIEP